MALRNQDLSPGHIVEWLTDPDGIQWGVRKDGKRLKSAAHNPWYVLMTLAGEQVGEEFDRDLAEQNRKYWNAWAGQNLGHERRTSIARRLNIDPTELDSWGALSDEVLERFQDRWSSKATLPDTRNAAGLNGLVFRNALWADKYFFPVQMQFSGSTFSRIASFCATVTSQGALFYSCTFEDTARFNNFRSHARGASGFDGSTFQKQALFTRHGSKQMFLFPEQNFVIRRGSTIAFSAEPRILENPTFSEMHFFAHANSTVKRTSRAVNLWDHLTCSTAFFSKVPTFLTRNFSELAIFKKLVLEAISQIFWVPRCTWIRNSKPKPHFEKPVMQRIL